jgi:diguanylate cyclase (GGDEF)-like protein
MSPPRLRYFLPAVPVIFLVLVALENLAGSALGSLIDEAIVVAGLLTSCVAIYLWIDRESIWRTLLRARAEKRGLEQIVARKATLETQLELTSAVRELALASAGCHDLDEVLCACAGVLRDLLDAPGAELAIYLPDPRRPRPRLRLVATADGEVRTSRRARRRDLTTTPLEGRLAEAMEGRSLSRSREHGRASLLLSLDSDTTCVGALHVSIPAIAEEADARLDQLEPTMRAISRHIALALYKVTLYDEATLDGLTGLYTKRQYLQRVPEVIAEAARRGTPLSFIVVDLDHFKPVNDTHGHAAGDLVLTRVAELIRRTVRDADLAIRFGGEEFVIVTPQDQAGATALAERLRERIRESPIRVSNTATVDLTVSLGVATLPVGGLPAEELFAQADQAVYHAKEHGRDCTSLWTPTGVVLAAESGLLSRPVRA